MVGDEDPEDLNFAASPKNRSSVRGTPGFQIHWANAISPSMMPMVTTILVTSAVCRSPRMMPR